MNILSLFSINNGQGRAQISKVKQAPFLPQEMFEKIFGYLKSSEVSQLSCSCKDWNHRTRSYLKWLKREVISVCKSCEDSCSIPIYQVFGSTTYTFACHLAGNNVIVQNSSSCDPEFYIKAKMRVINAPLADDAPYKQFKFFFKSCTCVEFACISFDEVLSIDQRYNLNQIQRERIHAIYMAMKIYLKNRFLNKSTE